MVLTTPHYLTAALIALIAFSVGMAVEYLTTAAENGPWHCVVQ
jgi:hypothetical protein